MSVSLVSRSTSTTVSYYAGIGSRSTPPEVLETMKALAGKLAKLGYVLRSGAADGADAAFEAGCVAAGGQAEIWLPWPKFNDHADTGLYPTEDHFKVAESFHPAWVQLTRGPRALHSRNVGQILGASLHEPVDFVVCWTPDGCDSESTRSRSTGGTGSAIAIAASHGIPVFNLAKTGAKLDLLEFLISGHGPNTALSCTEAGTSASSVAEPINISSNTKGLGGALTNMSELSKQKGNIKHSYPVLVNQVQYPDVEAAYQALKWNADECQNDGLMVDLISLKFKQHPRLLTLVRANGGVTWLLQCSHVVQKNYPRESSWTGQGQASRFICNLAHGYHKALTGEGPKVRTVHVQKAPYDVYIGRKNGGLPESIWHNPFVIGTDGDRDTVIAAYYDYVLSMPNLLGQLDSLRGKTLGCWCKTKAEPNTPCHGDVLAALVDGREWVKPNPMQASLF